MDTQPVTVETQPVTVEVRISKCSVQFQII